MRWKSFEYRGIIYQVSDTGVIVGPRGKSISQRLNKDGYYEVTLGSTNQRNARVKVHRIVALNFVDGYQDSYEVNHKDYNRQNNCASNLEWVTHQDNIRYSSLAGRYNIGKHRGSHNGRSKLCEQDVAAIRQMLNSKMPVSHLARQFGVGWTTIQHIKNGDTWVGI